MDPLASPLFDRSDLAAEYYSRNVFDGKTFGDMFSRQGPTYGGYLDGPEKAQNKKCSQNCPHFPQGEREFPDEN